MKNTLQQLSTWIGRSTLVLAGALVLLVGSGCDGLLTGDTETGELTLVSEPEGAQIFVNGDLRGVAPLVLSNLAAGTHLIEARRTGYRPHFHTVNLFAGQRTLHEIRLEPLHALLLIESDPTGADVLTGDAYRGRTPLLVHDLRPGTYRIRLRADDFFPRELTVNLEGRTPQRVFTELESDTASLQVRSNPDGGQVRIDGASIGETPVTIDRARTGEVLVEITRDGFLPYQRELRLRSGQEYRLDAELVPLPSGLTVATFPPGAQVHINDQLSGESPLSLTNLAVGVYTVRVDRHGFAPQEREVELASGDRRIEEFRLERTSGTLVLVTEPAGVEVVLNGERVGTTQTGTTDVLSEPLTIDYVLAGEHRLQLLRAGYSHRPRTFQLEANQTLSLHERMQRRFVPDTRVRTGERAGEVFTGVLIQEHPDGSIDLETRPGIIMTLPTEDILAVEPLQAR